MPNTNLRNIISLVWIIFFSFKIFSQETRKDSIYLIEPDSIYSNELSEEIKASAFDSIIFFPKLKTTILYKKAEIETKNESGESLKLTSGIIEMNEETKVVTAKGILDSTGKLAETPVFLEGSNKMEAEKIAYNLQTNKGKIWNAYTTESNMIVYGNEIKKDDKDILYLKNLKCIPCEYKDAQTFFVATKAKVIPDDKIVTGPMYLEIAGIPTPLFLPFGYFPNTKRSTSGFLMPFVGNSPTQGYFLKDGGLYWAISEKIDLFLRGDIYTNGSWGIRALSNYYFIYKAQGAFQIGYSEYVLGDKDISSNVPKTKSYQIIWKHFQDNKLNPTIRFSADVNYNANKFNQYNAINTGQYLNNAFLSNVAFSKTFRFGVISLNGTHSQNSQTHYAEMNLPQLTINVNRFFPFNPDGTKPGNILTKLGISYVLESRVNVKGTDTTLFEQKTFSKRMQTGIRQTMPINTTFNLFKYITVTPGINLSMVSYPRSIRKSFQNNLIKTDTIQGWTNGFDANANVSVSLKVFTDVFFNKGKIKQLRYMLIPTFSYVYRPDLAKSWGYQKTFYDTSGRSYHYSIFENTLYGGPVIGQQNILTFNLNNNIESKMKVKTDTGISYKKITLLQNLGISGSYNFAADSFQLSNITFSARNKLWKFFDFLVNATADPYYFDKTSNRRINKYLAEQNGQLVRWTSFNFALNGAITSSELKQLIPQIPQYSNSAERGTNAPDLPWRISINYNLSINLSNPNNKTITQGIFTGIDWSITKNWKIGASANYDLKNKKFAYSSIDLKRDLKCWEASIRWVPFGQLRSYMFSINLKHSMLSEFKIPRQRQWFDNL
ncbi:MAG TPA: putative LPS assembly protein LptD [Bacteroidia bacterium]|nr:putative LPS assembly protein LptD [Bacteroidia bacterium]